MRCIAYRRRLLTKSPYDDAVTGEAAAVPPARAESIYDAFRSASGRSGSFDPSTSALFRRVGFIVGAPRSGTTWLQQLLLVHPLVATGGESHMFCDDEGVAPLFRNFDHPDRMSHLRTWVSEAELLSAARAFCDTVLETQRAGTRADATIVVEKTPNHRLQAALQARLYPDGRYVHIVRDGRDATSSQRQLWGRRDRTFADPDTTARAWADAVRDIRQHFGALAYLELRYEDVVRDTAAALAKIFDHLELPHDAELREAAASFGRAPVHTWPTSADVGVRKHEADRLAARATARVAGDLLVELGYADRSEVERLRRTRSVATARADVAAGTARRWRRAVSAVFAARGRRAVARRRAAASAAIALADALAEALLTSDEPAVARALAPHAVLDGGRATGVEAVARSLVERFGGHRAAHRGVVDNMALLTLLSGNGDRAVLRVREEQGLASAIDVL